VARLVYDFFNYFVPAVFRADSVQHTRAVIWVAVVAFNTAVSLFGLLYIEFGLSDMEGVSNVVGRSLVFFTLCTYLIARVFYYRFHMLKTAGHMVIFGLFSSTLVGVVVTGGYTNSSMPVLLIIPATLAFIMMGMKPGMFWSVTTAVVMIGLWKIEQMGLIRPWQMLHSKSIISQLSVLAPLTTGAMVIGGMIIYETIAIQLQNILQNERNKFLWEATHDSLTGLPNRPEFYQRLQLGMHQACISNQSLALVYLDLDEFKPVNDTHGHYVGDEVLKVVSQRLQDVFRGSDTVSRLGGDEFAVILQGVNTNESLMKNILEKTLNAISDEIVIEDKSISVGASIGVAYYNSSKQNFSNRVCDDDVKDLCRMADIALYQAKANKNTWCTYIKNSSYQGMAV
jgi:diguanylate cyclase (GGDEF)-like protein